MDRSRKPLSASIVFTAAVLLAVSLLAFTAPAVMAEQPLPTSILDWNKTMENGFHGESQQYVSCLQEYGGHLYAGVSAFLGCELWRYDGTAWEEIAGPSFAGIYGPGFGRPARQYIDRMTVYDDVLYMTPHESGVGCEVWTYDGSDLNKLVGPGLPGDYAPGFGNANNSTIHGLSVFDGKIYFGTYNGTTGCEVWTYDGAGLAKLVGTGLAGKRRPGFGNASNECAHSMAIYGGKLIIAAYNEDEGCTVWSYDGSAITQLVGQDPAGTPGTGPGFGYVNNDDPSGLAVFMDRLYVSTYNDNGCQVWSYDGTAWTKEVGPGLSGSRGKGFGNPNNEEAYLQVYGSSLFAGTYNYIGGAEVWRYDGSNWAQECTGGIDDPGNQSALTFAIYGPNLYTSMDNPNDGPEIWKAAYTFFFAEGYTGAGFQEYLCLGNPQPVDANVLVTFMFPDGTTQEQTATVPANFRSTLDVNTLVGPGKDVSCKIEADQPIVAERPMYFVSGGGLAGGHDAIGATAASKGWYFAEGYTGPGFQEYICVLNPGDTVANLTFRFQTQEEGEKVVGGISVLAHSRGSFNVNSILGANYQTSLALESDVPVVAERPMYFDYHGWGNNLSWTGGHCVMGAYDTAKEFYFAEGATYSNFEECLTIQNPNDFNITVNAVYQPAAGQGGNIGESYTIGDNERSTVFVPTEAGYDKDLSVRLYSDDFFLAERPMYFRYTGFGADYPGGDCAIGSPGTAPEWFFAEGCTLPGFQQWLTLQNPGDTDAQVEIYYYTQEAGPLLARSVTVPAETRVNVLVNTDAGANYQLSCRVRVVSGPDIVAERPMYFDFAGIKGGHVVVGYAPGGFPVDAAAAPATVPQELAPAAPCRDWTPADHAR